MGSLTSLPGLPALPARVPQGFVQFRLSGERIHLDVDTLNEQMKIQGASRLRWAAFPPSHVGGALGGDTQLRRYPGLRLCTAPRLCQTSLEHPAVERMWGMRRCKRHLA